MIFKVAQVSSYNDIRMLIKRQPFFRDSMARW